ncbi:hypothetical protein LX32DRAFT_328132 [Colletotrichum zoysiae]|uniref:Tat pathway signal sequence n=1 Tax=Colletotrichum zoysiae TaxID=1216348 RepID=A0AAD9HM90_9PEZI|nr:hypothetical protein LX32DRAFT_328132 [Colletotrichum zoysiae]
MGEEQTFEQESDGLLSHSKRSRYSGCRWGSLGKWFTFLSVSLNIIFAGFGLAYWIGAVYIRPSSYETGFNSDLEAIKSQIQLTQQDFTGGVKLDKDGKFFTDHDSQIYVAAPSPEVDNAWYELLTGLNIDLKEPGKSLSEKTFQWPDSGLYFTGLEVFHSLHCLNRLRQALYPRYYDVFNDPNDPSREDHIGHCINHLRQAIQCHGDLTPMEWRRVGKKIILNTETRHTCRDFDRIREWAAQRQTNLENIRSVQNGSLFIVD